MKLEYIIFFSTFSVFIFETLLHFMIGKHKIVLPETKETIQITIVVVVFSLINALLSKYLHHLESNTIEPFQNPDLKDTDKSLPIKDRINFLDYVECIHFQYIQYLKKYL